MYANMGQCVLYSIVDMGQYVLYSIVDMGQCVLYSIVDMYGFSIIHCFSHIGATMVDYPLYTLNFSQCYTVTRPVLRVTKRNTRLVHYHVQPLLHFQKIKSYNLWFYQFFFNKWCTVFDER